MQKHVKVDVFPKKLGAGKYDWDHKAPSEHENFWGLRFRKSQGDEFIITFTLDPEKTDLRFACDYAFSIHSSIWSCPPRGAVEDPFEVVDCEPLTLKVKNKNTFVKKYRYRLEFIEIVHGSEERVVWDPIVDNQNGNGHFYAALALKFVAGGAAVAGVSVVAMSLLGLLP